MSNFKDGDKVEGTIKYDSFSSKKESNTATGILKIDTSPYFSSVGFFIKEDGKSYQVYPETIKSIN